MPKKEDPKNVCKKCLTFFHTLQGLNQNLRTCSKLIEVPKERPDPPWKEDKASSPLLLLKDIRKMKKCADAFLRIMST